MNTDAPVYAVRKMGAYETAEEAWRSVRFDADTSRRLALLSKSMPGMPLGVGAMEVKGPDPCRIGWRVEDASPAYWSVYCQPDGQWSTWWGAPDQRYATEAEAEAAAYAGEAVTGTEWGTSRRNVVNPY